MQKIDKKHLRLLLFFCLFYSSSYSQAKSGVESYNLLNNGNEYMWMPIVHYQSQKGLYAELRYNYEDANTVSFYGGKIFRGGKDFSYHITPMAGYSVGDFTGLSIAVNSELEWRKIYFSSLSQYSIATAQKSTNFIFSWSEIGMNISSRIFAGIANQYTIQNNTTSSEYGFVGGVNFKNISIPLYVFSPFKEGRYFILGLNYEFNFKNK